MLLWIALAAAETVSLDDFDTLDTACALLQDGDVLTIPVDRTPRPTEQCFLMVGATVVSADPSVHAPVGAVEIFQATGAVVERLELVGQANQDAAIYVNNSDGTVVRDVRHSATVPYGVWVQDSVDVVVDRVGAGNSTDAALAVLGYRDAAGVHATNIQGSVMAQGSTPTALTVTDSALHCVGLQGTELDAAIVDSVLDGCPAPMTWIVDRLELSGVSACGQEWILGSGALTAHRVELRDSAGLTVTGGTATLTNWTVIGAPVGVMVQGGAVELSDSVFFENQVGVQVDQGTLTAAHVGWFANESDRVGAEPAFGDITGDDPQFGTDWDRSDCTSRAIPTPGSPLVDAGQGSDDDGTPADLGAWVAPRPTHPPVEPGRCDRGGGAALLLFSLGAATRRRRRDD
jgi:hypothetical protein